ncbi:motility associated factor glycosyltransferase family protein [Calorimonas adulescens]|uniref:Motility associated factor glycosyltransferase family protein n=2 Tax=Calorimonas adulescens TaxID=2606906 RepID=A0A5D8QDE3_9THEO|nr:motility associated factor glycosyltransferase family protein [Calorimonas adulescens]
MMQMEDNFHISIKHSKSSVDTATVDINGKEYYIHSLYDPIAEAKRWVSNIELKEGSIFVVFGLGLGYHIIELCKLLDNSSKVIVIEPSKELIDIFIKKNGLNDLISNGQLIICNASLKTEIYNVLSNSITYDAIDRVYLYVFGQYGNLFKESYNVFLEAFKECINAKRIDINTSLFFAERWQKNVILNLPYVIDSVPFKGLINMFKNRPGIIISAGPSLNKNIELLKEAKNKAVLMAVGTSVKALLKHNIIPDFVVAIDGSVGNYKHFKNIEVDCPLVYDLYLYPEIVEEYKGPKIISVSSCPYTPWIAKELDEDFGFINAGPTVANMAFDFARQLGCNPIIFVGQDLAYTDNKTHADGTTYEGQRIENPESENYIYVDDIYGNKVLSSKAFLSFKTWFEDQIYQHPDRTYIDATEGGAYIKGTKIMTLRDVINKYCYSTIDVKKALNEYFSTFNGYRKENIQKLVSDLKDIEKQIEKLEPLCERGEKLSKRLLDVYKKNIGYDAGKLLKDLDKIDKEIKEYKDGLGFLSIMLHVVAFKVTKGFEPQDNETEKEKGIRVSNMSFALYNGMLTAMQEIKPYLARCIENIQSKYLK